MLTMDLSCSGRASEDILLQVTAHHHARIFRDYYQNRKVQFDVQNAFIGLPSEDSVLKVASAMRHSKDPRMPWDLDQAEKAQILVKCIFAGTALPLSA